MNLHEIILAARLGRERKAAQEDTCGPFAVALFDLLGERGVAAQLRCVAFHLSGSSRANWFHCVVEVDGRLYDSMGAFDHEIVRARQGIHPKVESRIVVKPDDRACCYDPELCELHEFYLFELRRAMDRALAGTARDASRRPAEGP